MVTVTTTTPHLPPIDPPPLCGKAGMCIGDTLDGMVRSPWTREGLLVAGEGRPEFYMIRASQPGQTSVP